MIDATVGVGLLKKIRHMAEGFLMELQETAPGKLDCLALERSVLWCPSWALG